MSLHDALRAVLDGLPPGASVTLPAEWLRAQLAEPATREPDRLADLTVEEVARELGRAPSTVRGWLGAGALTGYRLNGREWRVTRAALSAFLAAQRGGTGPEPQDAENVDLGAWRRHAHAREN